MWRIILWIVVILAGAVAVIHRAGDIEALWGTVLQARPLALSLALALQMLTLLNQPALYQSLYALLGLPAKWRELAPLVWAGHFLNVATPSAGLGGTALLLDDARHRGWDSSRVLLANTLYFLLNFVWFAILLAVGLAALQRWHDLKSYEIVISSFLFGGILVALGALAAVAIFPALLEKPLLATVRGLNWLALKVRKTTVLSEPVARSFAGEFSLAIRALKTARGKLFRPLFHTLCVDGLEVAVLGACFAAFPGGGNITPALLIAGYAVGTLFLVFSITPQGIGVVEGVLTAMFVSLGVPLERATVVVLTYRGLALWLPLAAGFLSSRQALIKKTPL